PDALHISYIHSPVRYAWNQYFPYFASAKLGPFSRLLIPPVIHYLRMWDITSSSRVDYFIANSMAVAQRIEKYYRRQASVIYPPVDVDFFRPAEQKGEFFLIVSALVPYKRVDLAVEAFNRNGLPLMIVGQGPELKRLKKTARQNITFLGALSDEELLKTYRKALALLIPGEEDFGINSLEAQACGIPVIAYGRGGALETVLPEKSGLFFHQLSPESLLEVLDKFKDMQFNKFLLREHAEKFSRERFRKQIEAFIMNKWTEFRQTS
ncbi:MAG: glycosyltransferase, partial [Acidobacteriota bacterium]